MGGYGYGLDGGTWGVIGWILNLLFILLIVIGVILVVWWLVKQFAAGSAPGVTSSKALETLKERYAKGEIDKKRFEEMKKDLSS